MGLWSVKKDSTRLLGVIWGVCEVHTVQPSIVLASGIVGHSGDDVSACNEPCNNFLYKNYYITLKVIIIMEWWARKKLDLSSGRSGNW